MLRDCINAAEPAPVAAVVHAATEHVDIVDAEARDRDARPPTTRKLFDDEHGAELLVDANPLETHRALLDAKPSAFFSVSLVARKPGKDTAETNPYSKAFLARSPWKPKAAAVFGGVLDYERYGLFDRYVIRLIMTINKGPTDLHTAHEFTNWEKVDEFAGRIGALLPGAAT